MAIFMDKYDSKQISIDPVVQIKCTLQARKDKTKSINKIKWIYTLVSMTNITLYIATLQP